MATAGTSVGESDSQGAGAAEKEIPMFGFDWNDPQTMWLNYTNLALGVVTVICFAAVGYNIVKEVLEQRQKHGAMDREMKKMLSAQGHAMEIPGLGWTMADGGEPVPPPVFKRPPQPREKKG